jgi:F0F1-type ATP synthase assembly protein I
MQLREEDRRKVAAYYTLPFGFAAAVALFVGLGWVVDRWLGTSPIATVVGTFVGAAVGLFYLVSHALEIQRGDGPDTKNQNGSSEPSSRAPDGK